MKKEKRQVASITKFEVDFINLVNDTLRRKEMNTNDLARLCGSNNYGNFERYFLKQEGQFRSRTFGKVADVLNLTTNEKIPFCKSFVMPTEKEHEENSTSF